MVKWVYSFGGGQAEGDSSMRAILGGKGANLAEMTKLGLPVPAGVTISTELCKYYYNNEKQLPEEFQEELDLAMQGVEKLMGKKFGDERDPLLLSVRSGAPVSMPGMMDTILNLGLNSKTVSGLANSSGDERFAYDSYRRFIQMYSDVVLGVSNEHFEEIVEDYKELKEYESDSELTAQDFKILVDKFKQKLADKSEKNFPETPFEQLKGAIIAVLESWETPRAKAYRKYNEIDFSIGTAVNIQAMVFGNMGDDSATGVAFSRNPSSGEKHLYGEYLINAQGEDVVAGIRTPQPINEKAKAELGSISTADTSLEEHLPEIYKQFNEVANLLEAHYRDMQDIEFTIERGNLWLLQTRSGKRTTKASLKIAIDMAGEGLISQKEAVGRVSASSIDQLLHPSVDENYNYTVLATGLPASPGAATGIITFSASEAEELSKHNKVILVRNETSPDDIKGMHSAEAVLTSRGGMTSHAAVVARGMGKPCICGASSLHISESNGVINIDGKVISAGEWITVEGSKGEVIEGRASLKMPEFSEDFITLMDWADKYRKLSVYTNAETTKDLKTAIYFGCEGVGLCRSEHMFFDIDKLALFRQMIVARDEEFITPILEKLGKMQQADFEDIFRQVKDKPISIRLLDPPLHEFLPHTEKEIKELTSKVGESEEIIKARINSLKEHNPMLGHRGCRLGITREEIYKMQVKAIFEAGQNIERQTGIKPNIEVLIPLVSTEGELKSIKSKLNTQIETITAKADYKPQYKLGTMIEVPRAALIADKLAPEVDYFSFGSNDLTQTCFGISRDDSSSFLLEYIDKGIIQNDPFQTLDRDGVGELIRIATNKGRSANKRLKLGICGEHGGDPDSIEFCHQLGLDYVSCSPYRIPAARLAAAQAGIKNEE